MSVAASWQRIARHAVLGTARERADLELETGDDALRDALGALDGDAHRDDRLLDAAAVVAIYRRCGRGPGPALTAPLAAPKESKRYVSHLAVGQLRTLLAGARSRVLLDEWLDLVRAAGQIAPPDLLPPLLELGRRDRRAREAVLSIVGERGRWLAQFEPSLGYAARKTTATGRGDEADWEEGSHALRVRYLERLRGDDPARARALLERTLTTEQARERAGLLASLRVGLSDDDEPLLEACLDDRAEEVRRAAARLLARLPSSRLLRRMLARLEPLMSFDGGVLVVELPTTCDDAMQRDGILADPPRHHGKRSWWLEQMLAACPPSAWSDRFGASPTAILESATACDHRDTVVEAWLRATRRHADAAWAAALVEVLDEGWADVTLWACLPRDRRREELVQLVYGAPTGQLERRLEVLLDAHPEPFDDALSLVVARALRRLLDAPTRALDLAGLLDKSARRLRPRARDAIVRVLTEGGSHADDEDVADLVDTLGFRRAMHDAIGAPATP